MRIPTIPFVLLALLSTPLPSWSLADEKGEDSPQAFIEKWAATFDKNDPALMSSFYDASDELEVVVSAGVRHHGIKALEKAYADDVNSVHFYDSEAVDISTRVLGDTALVSFEHKFKVRIKADRTLWQVHIRTTTVLHRMNGQWKIVLEHSSPIEGTPRFRQISN